MTIISVVDSISYIYLVKTFVKTN